MTKSELDNHWLMRLGAARIFVFCFCATSVLLGIGWYLGHSLGILASFGIAFGVGVLCVAGVIFWVYQQCKHMPPSALAYPQPVALRTFLAQKDAVIAPNLSEKQSEQLAAWLLDFLSRHGDDSLWILPHEDTPASSDRVLLVVEELQASDKAMLLKLHVDGVSTLQAGMKYDLLPHIRDHRRVYEALWD